MSRHLPESACARRDDVVAHFLDGHLAADSPEARFELDEHRVECADCREALARARRLDALVASAGRWTRAEETRVDAWLDAAVDALDRVPRAGRPRLRWVAALAAAALFATGLAVGVALSDHDPEAVEVTDASPGTSSPGSAALGGTILLPDRPARSRSQVRVRSSRPDTHTLAAMVESDRLWLGAAPLAVLRGGLRVTVDDVARIVDEARRAAVVELAARRDEAATSALVDLAARLTGERSFGAVSNALRVSEHGQLALVNGVQCARDLHLRAAARVGGARVDRALLEFVAGDPDRAVQIARLMRSAPARPGRASLLLETWRDVETRGRVEDSGALGARLFEALGAADAIEVCAQFDSSRNAPVRERCLLALAELRSPFATDTLTRVLQGANRHEAVLAAFALGRMPAAVDALHEFGPDRHARPLWLTALASRRDRVAQREIVRMSISSEERAFLLEGGFSVGQVAIAARLFRERGARAD